MPNKPNLAVHPGGQGPTIPNEPNLGQPGRCPQANSAKQSQFRQSAAGAKERNAPNEPNSRPYADPEIGVPGRGKCAKQTQLRRSLKVEV
jgi:hypothetical protein